MSRKANILWNILFALACFALGLAMTSATLSLENKWLTIIMVFLSMIPYAAMVSYSQRVFGSYCKMKADQ